MTSIGLVVPLRRRERRERRLWRLWWLLGGLAARWQRARLRRETRRTIMMMDEHMLSDLGVSRAQALFEIDTWR